MEQASVPKEFLAVSAHRGHVPWLGLLLAAFLLTLWIPPTTARFRIVRTIALEGQDVILRLHNTPPNVTGFIWYRDIGINYQYFIASRAGYYSVYLTGSEYIGRAEINLDGSLIIRNVTVRDRGIYMVVAVLPNSRRKTVFGWLDVYRQVSVPTLLASKTTVTENEDAVVMTCHTDESYPAWFFNSMSLQFKERMKLTTDRKTLRIDPVRREDAGSYQCKVYNFLTSAESVPVKLYVKY